ncbi:MAG: selenide, water dikinase SelD [Thermoflavifilum sp.]|nr:selenide, water dikinase SelD [Thermoflavifilum sp.]
MDKPSSTSTYRLTQFAHGAGCGCKISPAVLEEILQRSNATPVYPQLIVGFEHRDDAAVVDLGNERALISTTDFFMPIVDDPYDFGRIAAANALSDVYAMGGSPLVALAILGWPVNKLPANLARAVVEGGRDMCAAAGVPLAGGHSIDAPEPIFGLCVNGLAPLSHIKRNHTARPGDQLYLTKPLGIGILSTAEKQGLLQLHHRNLAIDWMTRLNRAGNWLGSQLAITAMTDVTGFGLLGHLLEMVENTPCTAVVEYHRLPLITPELHTYIMAGAVPGGTRRNWQSYGNQVSLGNEQWINLLADPQTSGGLLFAVKPESAQQIVDNLTAQFPETPPQLIGEIVARREKPIEVH